MTVLARVSARRIAGEFISPAVTVPAIGPETKVIVTTAIAVEDLLNPLLSIEAALELSTDGGATWEHELSFTWRGGPRSPLIPATLAPWASLKRATADGVAAPLRVRGALVRMRLQVPSAMRIGVSLEAI